MRKRWSDSLGPPTLAFAQAHTSRSRAHALQVPRPQQPVAPPPTLSGNSETSAGDSTAHFPTHPGPGLPAVPAIPLPKYGPVQPLPQFYQHYMGMAPSVALPASHIWMAPTMGGGGQAGPMTGGAVLGWMGESSHIGGNLTVPSWMGLELHYPQPQRPSPLRPPPLPHGRQPW
jgi:hypothetical protein